ncbi:MAG: NUDIX hydrolase [Acidimicrobiales bacterium]|nr:NUDIX hydrolase [Acidimicrobiales bacterium]
MRWTVHGERLIYDSEWVRLALVDVEIPGERRFEHHVIRQVRPAAGVIVVNDAHEVLLLWRHRFITDTWGWEIPAGGADPDEPIDEAARREVVEETGWEPGPLTELVSFHPTNGVSDQTFTIYLAIGATHRGEPTDASESERLDWLPVSRVRQAVRDGEIPDGLSLTALSYALAVGALI